MVKRYALDFRRAEMFEIASGYYVTHADYATLEAENAKLRDLLRWVCAHPEVRLTKALRAEIKSAIEPGNPGELEGA